MRIVLVSSFVPFVHGGARFIVEWLETKLVEAGHDVERFYLPAVDRPEDLLDQSLAYRLIDVTQSCDRVIAFRPPSHLIQHPNKVLWFIHHIRTLYDMWDTPYRMVPDTPDGRAFRQTVIDLDTRALREAHRIFTNSNVVTERLQHYNGVAATTLYPPVFQPERFHSSDYGDEIVVVSRIEPHKRQHLLVEAMHYTTTPVKLRLCGTGSNREHMAQMREVIDGSQMHHKVALDDRWISEEEKVAAIAPALAVAYIPKDEDSYGYPSLEAAHAQKAVLTTSDSGGVLELVRDGDNGLIVEPEARALAAAMDKLYLDKAAAARMGRENQKRLDDLGIGWDHVVRAMTA